MSTKERITITVDPEVLARIDEVAEVRGESRSGVIERMLRNGIGGEAGFVNAMGNPVIGPVVRGLTSTPWLLEAIAALALDRMSPEEADEIRAKCETISEGVKARKQRRRAERKGA